jgi:hypothetical protein
MAMLKPERLNMGTSVGCRRWWRSLARHPEVPRQKFHHRALVRVLVRHIEIIGLRAVGRRALPKGRLGVGLAALHRVQIVADADDLGDLVQLFGDIRHDLRLELDGPGLVGDVRRIGLPTSQSLPR